jgi:hypothetical protein
MVGPCGATRRFALPLAASLLSAAVLMAPGALAKTKTKSCPNEAGGSFTILKIKATGTTCRTAAKVAAPAPAKSGGKSSHYTKAGFSCKGSRGRLDWLWTCKDKKKKVSFSVAFF